MYRPRRQFTRLLNSLIVAVMLLGNSMSVWAAVVDMAQEPIKSSEHKPCHGEQASLEKAPECMKACCEAAKQCVDNCAGCPMMATPALLANFTFTPAHGSSQLVDLPQTTPKQTEPVLFLQPPRQHA